MAVTTTPTTPNPGGVSVVTSRGQYLRFVVDAGGPNPIFSFASGVKGVLYQATDFVGHPMARYEWYHLKNPSDIQGYEVLLLGLAFLTNANYTYTVELWDGTGLLSTVLKIDYVGAPTDTQEEPFTVVTS